MPVVMTESKYTFLANNIKSNDLLIINYLSGSADIIEKGEEEELKNRLNSDSWMDYHLAEYMLERKYIFKTSDEEEKLIQEKYQDFQKRYEASEIQIIFAMTYDCNFNCSYCYQENYSQNGNVLSQEVTEKFFDYINNKFSHEIIRPYITLFGGEPLMEGKKTMAAVKHYLERAARDNYEVAIVTNGFTLESYLPVFKESGVKIREIQVTLDGDREKHDQRRFIANGEPTFDNIVRGIELALANDYHVNLRYVLDRDNIHSLDKLAEYCKDKGWLGKSDQFQTNIGRNYELNCSRNSDNLYSRFEMWKDYSDISEKSPVLRKFHRPDFHGMRELNDSGELPPPVFDSCPACKKEWAFDLYGRIYGCTATVGVDKYCLGSFTDPDVSENTEAIQQWKSRNVLNMEKCRDCPESLSCGGGCGALACNYNGSINEPDCRPVKELIGLGTAYYDIVPE